MSSFQRLFDLIGELARRRLQAGEQAFASLGLNHTEARLLTLLDREGGDATQEVLSGMLHIDRSNAGRALKHLEQGGYIARQKSETDKRANLLQMRPRGRKAVLEISKLRNTMAQSFFGDLEEDEAEMIADLLIRALAKGERKMTLNRPRAKHAGE